MAVVVAVAVAAAVAAVPHRSVVVVRAASTANRVNLASRVPNSLPLLPCRPRPRRLRKYSSHVPSHALSRAKRGLIVRRASVGRSNVASGAGNIEANPVANTGASAVRSVITNATMETHRRVWAITCRRSSLVARTPCRPSSSW